MREVWKMSGIGSHTREKFGRCQVWKVINGSSSVRVLSGMVSHLMGKINGCHDRSRNYLSC